MNARSTVTMTEQQRIERALDMLLTEANRQPRPPWPGQNDGLTRIGDATRAFLQQHNPLALRGIGERLLEAMQRGLWAEPGEHRERIEAHVNTVMLGWSWLR